MEIGETKQGEFVVLSPVGLLDMKNSFEFEKKVVALLDAGSRRFVIDLADLEYMSSAGLRVLLMLAKKLSGTGGHLALCSMNDAIRQVFEIAGFTSAFVIASSRADAVLTVPLETKSTGAAEIAATMLGFVNAGASPKGKPGASAAAIRAARLLGASTPDPVSSPPSRPVSPESSDEKSGARNRRKGLKR